MAFSFLRHGLFHLEGANKAGHHAIAISLLRQCADPLFVVECALVRNEASLAALDTWAATSGMSVGKLRKDFADNVWSEYEHHFLDVAWPDFIGDFYRSVQTYAHFNSSTLQWALNPISSTRLSDGAIILEAKQWSYCAEKATRVTLFQSVLIRFLAEALRAGARLNEWELGGIDEFFAQHETGIRDSNLVRHPFSWENELLGMTFDISQDEVAK
tara:strand:+ start:2927 stop:3571 length:645 start_codon:yes stop_codon:yes gene_type:complete